MRADNTRHFSFLFFFFWQPDVWELETYTFLESFQRIFKTLKFHLDSFDSFQKKGEKIKGSTLLVAQWYMDRISTFSLSCIR